MFSFQTQFLFSLKTGDLLSPKPAVAALGPLRFYQSGFFPAFYSSITYAT
jgi:hypothetical protein